MNRVYKSGSFLFSEAVRRDFGENRTITLLDGETIFATVQPLKVDPKTLELIGFIE
jgi:hypothetical protein